MSEQPTHAMLVRADDGLHLLPACTARVCAERSVTFSTGADVLGVVELYPEPIVGTRVWAHFQQHGRGPATAAELAAPARDARDDEISMLRDALDHIARTAYQSRTQTVRIRWIEARANGALEGKPYVRGQFREPKNKLAQFEKMEAEIKRMQASQPGLPELQSWAVGRWNAQVANRPLQNVHRRTLDSVWRQVMRHCGGDDIVLCGPRHDQLLAEANGAAPTTEPDDVPDPATNWADADPADYPNAVIEQEQPA